MRVSCPIIADCQGVKCHSNFKLAGATKTPFREIRLGQAKNSINFHFPIDHIVAAILVVHPSLISIHATRESSSTFDAVTRDIGGI